MKPYINLLAVYEEGTQQLGPGVRYCIWVQGCPFRCKGCTTPEGIPIRPNKMTLIEDLALSIIQNTSITGITISGGEPFLQASKLTLLLSILNKLRPELNVIVFTGYTIEELVWEHAVSFLNYIDVLIDGKYIDKLNNNEGLRGSSNQNIHFLTDRLTSEKDYFYNRKRSVDLVVENNQLVQIGIPNKSLTI